MTNYAKQLYFDMKPIPKTKKFQEDWYFNGTSWKQKIQDHNDFNEMSIEMLEKLVKNASKRIEEIKNITPTYQEAINAGIVGIVDRTYETVNNGSVASYSGDIIIEREDIKWRCLGRRPNGDGNYIDKEGYIEFIPMTVYQ